MNEAFRPHLVSRNFLLGLLAAASLTACTHLQTNPTGDVPSVQPGMSARHGAQRGLSYALPMVQYDLKLTRSLDACPGGVPRISVKAVANERYIAGERFEINYEAMSSVMKTTNFDITYHESGTIKSINATARDQTGPVITDIARIGLAVAAMTSGVPVPPGLLNLNTLSNADKGRLENLLSRPTLPGVTTTITLRCTATALQLLGELEAATNDVKRLTGEVAGLTADITRLSTLASLEVMSDPDKELLSTKVRALLTTESLLRAALDLVAARQSALSATQELTWPNQAGDISAHQDTIPADPASLDKLWDLMEVRVGDVVLTRAGQQLVPVSCPDSPAPRPALQCLNAITSLNVRLVPAVTQSTHPRLADAGRGRSAVVTPTDRRWARGIFIREPVDARLIICLAPAQVTDTGCSDRANVVLRDKLVVAPQLGRLRLLPFTNGPFENSALQLSVRANGFIEHFQYGQESSAAAASATLAGIAERTQTALEAMETERRSDIQYIRDTRTYERTEMMANRAEEVAQLTHQANLLKGQSDLLATQLALSAASDTSQYAAEKARIDAEVQLLQSRIARLKAANELAALNAN